MSDFALQGLTLIAGSAVNHEVPNEHAQRELVRSALRSARIDASDVQLIETHGTATSLGDPIEAAAELQTIQTIQTSDTTLPRDASLLDLGIDSLTAAELRNAIERTIGASVPMDLFIDGSSLDRVIDIVFTQVERHLITPHTSATDTQMENINL